MALVLVEGPQGSRRPAPDVPFNHIMEAIEEALGHGQIIHQEHHTKNGGLVVCWEPGPGLYL